jgi:hypothetical protein
MSVHSGIEPTFQRLRSLALESQNKPWKATEGHRQKDRKKVNKENRQREENK